MKTVHPATSHCLLVGDAGDVLKDLPEHSIDVIITPPPYAKARASSYGGVAPEAYVSWFLPIAAQLQRVLKPSGSFILNIKEGCQRGERSTYVLELILALRDQGWLWTEEYVWHKKHCYPGKWPNRFRDAWERLLQFNVQRHFAMYQDAVRVPAKGSTVVRGQRLSADDHYCVVSGSGSGLSRRMVSCVRIESRTGSRFGRGTLASLAAVSSTPTMSCTRRSRPGMSRTRRPFQGRPRMVHPAVHPAWRRHPRSLHGQRHHQPGGQAARPTLDRH